MGSFNTSCFISNQIISPGNKVVLFPIGAMASSSGYRKKEAEINGKTVTYKNLYNMGGYCHANMMWDVMGMMLTGVYGDYGRFELDKTLENLESLYDFFMLLLTNDINDDFIDVFDLLQNKTLEELVSEHGELYVYVKFQEYWKYVSGLMYDQELFIQFNYSIYQIQLSVISKYTFDYIINSREFSYNKSNGKEYFYVKMNNAINRFYEVVQEKNNKVLIYDYWLETMLQHTLFKDLTYNLLSYGHVKIYKDRHISILRDMYSKDKQITADIIYKMIKYRFNFNYFISMIDSFCNVKIMPVTYAGQDYGNEFGDLYIKMTKSVNKKLKQERKSN